MLKLDSHNYKLCSLPYFYVRYSKPYKNQKYIKMYAYLSIAIYICASIHRKSSPFNAFKESKNSCLETYRVS